MKRCLNNKGHGQRFIVPSRASFSFSMAAQMDSVLAKVYEQNMNRSY